MHLFRSYLMVLEACTAIKPLNGSLFCFPNGALAVDQSLIIRGSLIVVKDPFISRTHDQS